MNKTKQLASAQSYMRKGQYRKAIAAYERVLGEDPNDVRARLNLANLYCRREDTPRAVETFLQVAKIYEESGATLKAIAVYKQVLKLDPNRADIFVLLADNYEQHGLLNEAGTSYQQSLRLLGSEGDKASKLDVIRRILELDPSNLVDRIRLAEAFSALGHLKDAVRQFRRVALELDRLGHDDAFRRIGERLLYHHPDDAIVAKKLAASYVLARAPHRALSKLKIAFKHTPRDLEVLGTLVDAFISLGQVHKGVTVLREMARQYDKSGLIHERDDCYREILTLDPDNTVAAEYVKPMCSPQEGKTIEFDENSGSNPRPRGPAGIATASPSMPPDVPPLPPPLPPPGNGAVAADAPPPLPLPRVDRAPTTGDVTAEAAISQLLNESLESDVAAVQEAIDRRAARPISQATAGDLEALFVAAIDEVNGPHLQGEMGASPRMTDAASYARADASLDDSAGFGTGERESTDVDVQLPTKSDELRIHASEQSLREALQMLDFYLHRTLVSEARSLLDDLQERYHDHPELTRRAETLARLA